MLRHKASWKAGLTDGVVGLTDQLPGLQIEALPAAPKIKIARYGTGIGIACCDKGIFPAKAGGIINRHVRAAYYFKGILLYHDGGAFINTNAP